SRLCFGEIGSIHVRVTRSLRLAALTGESSKRLHFPQTKTAPDSEAVCSFREESILSGAQISTH
ncbi:hypothetical protein KDL45_08520, partial [bacterium]|nr:hypothetical protein [bacterium]